MLDFQILATDPATASQPGSHDSPGPALTLNHGVVQTPIFMPVGTYGTVKGVMPRSLHEMDAQIILGNTFHLWMRPGLDVVKQFGGLHAFENWDKPILTDRAVSRSEPGRDAQNQEEGVKFASPVNGDKLLLTPEISMRSRRCSTATSSCSSTNARPTCRSRKPRARSPPGAKPQLHGTEPALGQALPGRICAAGQPQRPVRHRAGRHVRAPARRVAGRAEALDFPGIAVGGLARRAQEKVMLRAAAHRPQPPAHKTALPDGRGHARRPGGRVLNGIDMFDCVMLHAQRPQRPHLHPLGDLKSATRGTRPTKSRLTKPAPAITPARARRGSRERRWPRRFQPRLPAPPGPLRRDAGPMLTSIHNLHYYLNLMAENCAALDAGQLSPFLGFRATGRGEQGGSTNTVSTPL